MNMEQENNQGDQEHTSQITNIANSLNTLFITENNQDQAAVGPLQDSSQDANMSAIFSDEYPRRRMSEALRQVPHINVFSPYPDGQRSVRVTAGIPDSAGALETDRALRERSRRSLDRVSAPPGAHGRELQLSREEVYRDPRPTIQNLRQLRSEAIRLRTYYSNTWTNTRLSPEYLASQGLYYFNNPREVQCVFCLAIIRINAIQSERHILSEHQRIQERCPFLLGLPIRNIPINPSHAQFPRDIVEHNRQYEGVSSKDYRYDTFDQRLATFKNWPKLPQKPEELSQAGFRYTGLSDTVVCWSCNLELNQWTRGESPLMRHAIHSPKCEAIQDKIQEEGFEHQLTHYKSVIEQRKNKSENRLAATKPETKNGRKNSPLCPICFDNILDVILFPCRHVTCKRCLTQMKNCPMCQKNFTKYVYIYFGSK
jgi:hypothetical protein